MRLKLINFIESKPKLGASAVNYNSSGGSSVDSRKKPVINRPTLTPSSTNTTRGRTEDEENDFYISCAEEINRSVNSSLNNDSRLTQRPAFTDHIDQANKSAQTDSMFSKLEKLKSFTVAVFVDSFDDYSFDKSSNHNSPNRSPNLIFDECQIPVINYPTRRFNSQSDLDDVFLSKQNTPTTTKAPHRTDCFKFSLSNEVNKSLDMFIEDEAHSPSLKEFENIEKFQTNQKTDSTIIKQPVSPYKCDEVFMFTPSPTNFINLPRNVLVNKPPLGPSSSSPNNKQVPGSPRLLENQCLVNILNGSQPCLSTITECSNETFETCSNRSPCKADFNNKSHSTSYDDDDEDNQENWTIDKRTLDEFQNVTIRRAKNNTSLVSKSRVLDSFDSPDHATLTELDLINTSVKITDRLFEKFCSLNNDEIMQYNSITASYTESIYQNSSNEFSQTKSMDVLVCGLRI